MRTLVLSILAISMSAAAMATPTDVVVRVLSADGKFIGDHTGGARIILRNAKSGQVLATGLTKGGTGDTNRIMDASGRSPVIQTPDAATFSATIDIAQPTLVDMLVEGPLGRPLSVVKVRSQRWLMPGTAVTAGNGWMVELPGLAITPRIQREGQQLNVQATIELLCGCPITPNGRWDARDYQVNATVWRRGKPLGSAPLSFVSSPGGYGTVMPIPTKRSDEVTIYVVNTKTGNSGLVRTSLP